MYIERKYVTFYNTDAVNFIATYMQSRLFEHEYGLPSYRCGHIMEMSTKYNLRGFADCFTLSPPFP